MRATTMMHTDGPIKALVRQCEDGTPYLVIDSVGEYGGMSLFLSSEGARADLTAVRDTIDKWLAEHPEPATQPEAAAA